MDKELRKNPHKWADEIENRIKIIATAVFIIGLFVLSLKYPPTPKTSEQDCQEAKEVWEFMTDDEKALFKSCHH